MINQSLANRPVTLIKTEAQYSQSFGEAQGTEPELRAEFCFRPPSDVTAMIGVNFDGIDAVRRGTTAGCVETGGVL
jgi:hypothetical protein